MDVTIVREEAMADAKDCVAAAGEAGGDDDVDML